jgi:hypothetical protein
MSPSRARYVTACQQLLALGVVVMALVPATRVVSLDVVGVGPGQGATQPSISVSPDAAVGGSDQAGASSFTRGQQRCGTLSPRVAERLALTSPGAHRSCLGGRHAARTATAGAG